MKFKKKSWGLSRNFQFGFNIGKGLSIRHVKIAYLLYKLYYLHPRGIAQSGSALALGASGRKFESYYPDQAPVAQLDRATAF